MSEPQYPRFQLVLNSIAVGGGRRVIRSVLFVLLILAGLGVFAVTRFAGLREREAMDSAQIARNIARGRGFSTQVIRPMAVWFLGRNPQRSLRQEFLPDVTHGPVYPAILAAGFRLVRPSFDVKPRFRWYDPETSVVIPLGILFTLGTATLLWWAGNRFFDRRVAVTATLAFVFGESVLSDSISGLPSSLVCFLATAAACAALEGAVRKAEDSSPGAGLPFFALSAAFCGLAFLTRYGALALVPALAMFVSLQSPRFRILSMLGFLALFLAVIGPWLLRNMRVCGEPLGLAPYQALDGSVFFGRGLFERSLKMPLDHADIALALRRKFSAEAGAVFGHGLAAVGGLPWIGLFVASYLHRFIRDPVHHYRWCLAVGMGVLLFLGCLYGDGTLRLMRIFWPWALLYGAAMLFLLTDRLEFADPLPEKLIAGAVLMVGFLPVLAQISGPAPTAYPPYHPPYIARIANYIEKNEALCTDIPEGTAWYGERTSVLLPLSLDDYREMDERGLPIRGLYLTTETGNKPYVQHLLGGSDSAWLDLLNGWVPDGFPLADGIALPPGTREQLFLTEVGRFPQ